MGNHIVKCTLCGTDCTMPLFHNGKPYGYTCITKVTGKKAQKSNSIWLQGIATGFGAATIGGMKFNSLSNVRGDLVRVTKNDGFPIWRESTMIKLGLVQNISKYDPDLKLKTWSLK